MFLCEIFEPIVFETVLKLPTGKSRQVYVTDAFLRDLESWKTYSGKDIMKRLEEFIAFKLQNGTQPLGTKDGPMGGHHVIKGLWRYHLDHGKVILLYAPADTHIELFAIGDHNTIEGGTSTKLLSQKLSNISAADLKPWNIRSPKRPDVTFTEQHFQDITEWVYGMLDNEQDRAALQQFVRAQQGDFVDLLTGWAAETKPNVQPEIALREFFQQWEKRYRMPFTRFVAQALG